MAGQKDSPKAPCAASRQSLVKKCDKKVWCRSDGVLEGSSCCMFTRHGYTLICIHEVNAITTLPSTRNYHHKNTPSNTEHSK
jgi:hypothetical protein